MAAGCVCLKRMDGWVDGWMDGWMGALLTRGVPNALRKQ